MTRLVARLADLAERYDALYCDIWGVLHDGQAVHPQASAALAAFRAGGGTVVLLTNAPRPAAAVAAQVLRLGGDPASWDHIVTSGDAAQDVMLGGAVGGRVHHIGAAKDEPFFADLPAGAIAPDRVSLAEAEGVVVTGLRDDRAEVPDDYREELAAAAARGLPLLCANPDIVVDIGRTRVYCAGALAALYEELGGRTLYVGKPHAPIYALARKRAGLGAGARWLAVGDGLSTDLEGARREGVDCLFVTGGLAHDQFGDDPDAPDPARLQAWLTLHGQAPAWAIPALR